MWRCFDQQRTATSMEPFDGHSSVSHFQFDCWEFFDAASYHVTLLEIVVGFLDRAWVKQMGTDVFREARSRVFVSSGLCVVEFLRIARSVAE